MEFKWIPPHGDLTPTRLVRIPVFCDEQGYSEDVEFDDLDPKAWHIVMMDGEKPVGTGRVLPEREETWRIGRVAVLREYRGLGRGAALMRVLEERARAHRA